MGPMWDIIDHPAKAVGKSKQPVLSSVTVPSSPMTGSLQSVGQSTKLKHDLQLVPEVSGQ